MALDGVLARIPGLGGYLAQEQFDQRRALGDLSGVVTLAQAAEQARMAPLKQQMLQAQMAEMQRKAAEEQRAQTMLGDIVRQFGPRTETVRDADDEMTGTPGAVTQVQRPADLLGMGTAMLTVPGREGMGANLIATAEAAQGRRDAQVQAAQARMAELQMRMQDAQLSREQRAQAAAEQAQLRRDLVQMRIDADRSNREFAAAMRPPRAEPAPVVTEVMRDGKVVKIDARTGAVIGEAPPRQQADKPLNEYQGKAMMFGTRAAESHNILKELESEENLTRLAAGQAANNMPLVGRFVGSRVMTPEAQRIDQAQRNFVNAVLRQESGAVIADSEFANAQKQYFPQPGDTPAVIEQKRKNRETVIRGFQRLAGPAGTDVEAALNAPPATVTPRQIIPPQVGEVRQGYRYKGGDPANPASWEKQ